MAKSKPKKPAPSKPPTMLAMNSDRVKQRKTESRRAKALGKMCY